MTTRNDIVKHGAAALLGLAVLMTTEAAMAGDSAHDFSFQAIDGAPLPLASFKGRAVLVVNTASQCGFTPQYTALQDLWSRYRDKGLVVLGVPSNDFGGQEPGTEAQIKDFCETNFSVDFPLTAKAKVTGKEAHPFYQWASGKAGVMGQPRWNFHKFLIGPDGGFADWFSTPTGPTSDKVIKAVEKALPRGG